MERYCCFQHYFVVNLSIFYTLPPGLQRWATLGNSGKRFGRFGIAHGDLLTEAEEGSRRSPERSEGSSLRPLERRLSSTMSNAKTSLQMAVV